MWLRKWGRLVVGAETAWSIIMTIQASIAGATQFVGLPELHWPFYLLLALLGVAILIGLSVPADKLKPTWQKFYEEKQLMVDVYDRLVSARYAGGPARHKARATANRMWAELGERLGRLGISLPISDDYRHRTEWLAQMIGHAETKGIRKARRMVPGED